MISVAYSQIPYSSEQGISGKEQGIPKAEQGISAAPEIDVGALRQSFMSQFAQASL
jgi:hypothetical protein